ncbi:DUF6457 domain-containing protein [Arthrobacter pigmenti]
MSDQQQVLESWCRQLVTALELEGLAVDIDEVLGLAGVAAHGIVRPAAPLTTFIVGFAAGCASSTGQASDTVAINSASAVARRLVREHAETENDAGGSAGTEQGKKPSAGNSGLDTGDEAASAAQAQEAVQATFGSTPPPNGKDS